MLHVALVDMPFSDPFRPSIALTQLRASTAPLAPEVRSEILYLKLDFYDYFGRELYAPFLAGTAGPSTGFGDWLFRAVAFPDAEDNSEDYLTRYSRHFSSDRQLIRALMEKRAGVGAYLSKLIDRYDLTGFDVVGMTSMFSQNVAAFALARLLKERRPALKTLLGGANCETRMGWTIARTVPSIDYVFSGPSLESYPALIRALAAGSTSPRIRGVFTRDRTLSENVSASHEIGEETPIDASTPLDYDDYFAQLEAKLGSVAPAQLSIPFETSRGCWWGERSHCTFCGLNGVTMEYRFMSPEVALRQFAQLFRYWPRVLRFESVDNILPRPYLRTVLPALQPPEGASVFYEVKADLKDDELEMLARAGVTRVQPGIEALATSTLKLMRKGTSAFRNIQFLQRARDLGIEPFWNLLIGFPGETEEIYANYDRVLPTLTHLPPPSGVYPVRFDRFSPYFKDADAYGLDLAPMDFYDLVYPGLSDDDLRDLAYFFVDRNFAAAYLQAASSWLAPLARRISAWQDAWKSERPLLVAVEDARGTYILDTRSGLEVRHPVSPDAAAILQHLRTPLTLERIAGKLPNLPIEEIERQVEDLRSRGLLFCEDERLLSLLSSGAQQEETL